MCKSAILLIMAVLSATVACPQDNPALWDEPDSTLVRPTVVDPELPDSSDIALYSRKHFRRAAAEVFGFNIGLWAFDRYALNGHYARISWKTIKENFRHGFEWDDDHLYTNMFAHPYSGSLYFNAARSSGFNFWQSELFAVGGSAMWEMFMECEYPSTNDIIATPVGGAALGEVFFRTSDMIIDDRTSGRERFIREALALVINPMRGFNRLITGDAWRHRATPGRRFGMPPMTVDVSFGGRMLSVRDYDQGGVAGPVGELNIEYGDPLADRTRTPYDYFSFQMEFQAIKTQPSLSRVEIIGRLLSRSIIDKPWLEANIGMYQHFDYFDSDTITPESKPGNDYGKGEMPAEVPYKFGAPASVGAGAMFCYRPVSWLKIDGFVHLNGIFLGGVLTDFYRNYNRNYNWGAGFSTKTGLGLSFFDKRVYMRLAHQIYRLYTWQGYDSGVDWSSTPEGAPVNVQGDMSYATFNHFEASVSYRLMPRLYFTAGADFFTRSTRYDDIRLASGGYDYKPVIDSKQLGLYLVLTYSI